MADVTEGNLQVVLQEIGANDNTWGTINNNNLQKLVDAITEDEAISVTGGTSSLTDDQQRPAFLKYTGTLASNQISKVNDTAKKLWFVSNGTTGSFTLTIQTESGSGIAVTQGEVFLLFSDGTDVVKVDINPVHSGDISGSIVLTIGNDKVLTQHILADNITTVKILDDNVTYAKIQDITTTDRLLGRSSSGAGIIEEIVCTAAGRALIDDATAAAQRVTMGVVIGTDVQAQNALLADIAGLTLAQGDIIYYDGVNLNNLGPGTAGEFLKTQGAAANPVWGTLLPNRAYVEDLTYSEITSTIPNDDSKPQITEGTELLTVSFTPSSASARVGIKVSIPVDNSNDGIFAVAAVFDGNTDAIWVLTSTADDFDDMTMMSGYYEYVPGTGSAVTFSVRVGRVAGTMRINGSQSAGARRYGGALSANMAIQEIA